MCNAWNHSSGCRCGWGGDGHLGRGGGGWNPRSTWEGGYDLSSPNAICPVCSAAVYFIRPRNGGCIWLDEMGPPWPKHACMVTQQSQSRYPEPLEVPARPVPRWSVPEWGTAFDELMPQQHESSYTWAVKIGNDRLSTAVEPPKPVSPAYYQSTEPTNTYGVLQYLAEVSGSVATISLQTCDQERRRISRLLPSRFRAPDQADSWQALAGYIRDGLDLGIEEAQALLSDLKEECGWLLDPNWQRTNSGPSLVWARVQRACANYPAVDAHAVYQWMAILL